MIISRGNTQKKCGKNHKIGNSAAAAAAAKKHRCFCSVKSHIINTYAM